MFRWTKGLSFHLFLASKGGSRSFRTGPNKILEDRSFQDLKIAKRTSKDLFLIQELLLGFSKLIPWNFNPPNS